MISKEKATQIKAIWDEYINSDKKVYDTKGNELPEIDNLRTDAIKEIKEFIIQFTNGELDIYTFKTTIDSYNKRNNLWGFTATKGQMFFNQLVRLNEKNIDDFSNHLKQLIQVPKDIAEALSKIEDLEKLCLSIYSKADDKRKVPNPGSVGYFLSYFWQIHNPVLWPIIYTSQVNAYKDLDIWKENSSQKKTYEFFFNLNLEIRKILSDYSKKEISNWETEHALWNYKGNPNKQIKKDKTEENLTINKIDTKLAISASFELSDFLIPKVSRLVEVGEQIDKSPSAKGSEYEKLVAEIFKQLDFEVEYLGQGSGRNPDVIVRHREENTAFIIDAKAYTDGYAMGTDDRAIREYVSYYCPKLLKEGYKKIGFIIVSNAFKASFDSFINEVTWNTDIKRFILLTSEALLYLLAYKTRDRHTLSILIEKLIGFNNPVSPQDIIAEFDDV